MSLRGIALDHDQVRELPGLDGAEFVTHAHGLGTVPGRPNDDVGRLRSRNSDVELHLGDVVAMGHHGEPVIVAQDTSRTPASCIFGSIFWVYS